MPMHLRWNAVLAWLLLLLCVPETALASERGRELARAFDSFCLGARPEPDALLAKAKAIQGRANLDRVIPFGGGKSMHQRGWLVSGGHGEFEVTAADGNMAVGTSGFLGCGLTALDADGRDLAQSLASDGGLGPPRKRVAGDGKSSDSVSWATPVGGAPAQVLLSYHVPGMPGATINMIIPNQAR